MSKFTKELRQQIVEKFAREHNGQYSPELFLKEVRETGPGHPAYEWFKWDDESAANEHRLWQARCFAKDLRVSFHVEDVGRNEAVKVRSVEMPMVMSPIAGRQGGGGYVLTNVEDADHRAEHCRQAAVALRGWLKRYEAALLHAQVDASAIAEFAVKLEGARAPQVEAA